MLMLIKDGVSKKINCLTARLASLFAKKTCLIIPE